MVRTLEHLNLQDTKYSYTIILKLEIYMKIHPKANQCTAFPGIISKKGYTNDWQPQKSSFIYPSQNETRISNPSTPNTHSIAPKNIMPWMLSIETILPSSSTQPPLLHEDSYILKAMKDNTSYPENTIPPYEVGITELQSNKNGWAAKHSRLPHNTSEESHTLYEFTPSNRSIKAVFTEALHTLILTLLMYKGGQKAWGNFMGISPLPLSQLSIKGLNVQEKHKEEMDKILAAKNVDYLYLTNGLFANREGKLFFQNEKDKSYNPEICMISYEELNVSNAIILHAPDNNITSLHMVDSAEKHPFNTCLYCKTPISTSTMETFLNYYFSRINQEDSNSSTNIL